MTFIGDCAVPFLWKRETSFRWDRSSFHLPFSPLHLAIHHSSEAGAKDDPVRENLATELLPYCGWSFLPGGLPGWPVCILIRSTVIFP